MRLPASAVVVALLLSASVEDASAREPAEGPEAVLRLRAPGNAVVRVSQAALARLAPGLAGVDLAVHAGSDEVSSADRRAGDAVAFVALGEADRFRTYSISARAGPSTAPARVERPEVAVERFERAEDRVFGPVAAANPSVYDRPLPLWWLTAIPPGKHVDVRIPLPKEGVVASQPATVTVRYAQTHEGATTLAARWGDADLGVATSPLTPGLATARFTVPPGKVPAAGVPLRLIDRTAALPPPVANDASDDRGTVWVDSVSVDVATTAHGEPVRLVEDGVYRRLREVDGDPLLTARAPAPDPGEAAKDAEMVIVSTDALLPGARRLAAHRNATGVRAVVVPASHVWDRTGGGDASPEALRAYLTGLAGLRFALLCGDATYDRTDLVPEVETIPTAFARTKYNGATASDRLLVVPDPARPLGGPAIGRLSFRDPKDLEAYVDRVIRYETAPPADPTRRLLRFITSEGRFGPQVDAAIELFFAKIVKSLHSAYDVEVTFANPRSPYSWPPEEFNEKVVAALEEGALYFTYVGHGFAHGFDHLWAGGRRHPIFMSSDAERVEVRGTPPAMFVVACTTAIFDVPEGDGVGEVLMRRARGPVSYWGATRICHPVWNTMVGRSIARGALAGGDRRLGEIVQAAEDDAIAPSRRGVLDLERGVILAGMTLFAPGEDFERLFREGALMYGLLGDPALRVAFPREDLRIEATPGGDSLAVRVTGDLQDGAEVHVSLEAPRDALLATLEPAGEGIGPGPAAAMKRNHAKANDKAFARAVARAAGGGASADLTVPQGWRETELVVKAWAVSKGTLRTAAAAVTLPARTAPAGDGPPQPPR